MKSNLETWHIHIKGLVQGIGFRPFVYKSATNLGMTGWVKNDNDGLHIHINTDEENARKFYNSLTLNPPDLAHITASDIKKITFIEYRHFHILQDTQSVNITLDLAPDFATCEKCKAELNDKSDRRYRYPFITCTKCGPRYSIIERLPYDRVNTKMKPFDMCLACQGEYNSPLESRYYAQTISCPKCRIKMKLFDSNKQVVAADNEEIIELVVEAWRAGKIVGIKGIGGYLICCSATETETIYTLRRRKKRPDKPFALMYKNIKALTHFNLRSREQEVLKSAVSPIILVSKKTGDQVNQGICNHLSKVGIMIPYAPLFQLLLDAYDAPIIATSGNISNAPIVFNDEKALTELTEIAEYVLVHNREIAIPQDDSVMVYSHFFNQKILIRRSRGMAPSYFNSKLKLSKGTALAMGAFMKSTFAIQQHQKIYVSQYLGDLDNYDTEQNYSYTLKHLMHLLNVKPNKIVLDLHSQYSSTLMGEQLAAHLNIPTLKVQHHMAHFSALIGEHAQTNTKDKILGVIWDGTGMGSDNQIWGGEFFIYHNYTFDRCAHLSYFPYLANEKMAREPRLAALSICANIAEAHAILKQKFNTTEWKVYMQLLEKNVGLQTSSMGRLFDAVASLIDLCDVQSYQGHAAGLLQSRAEQYFIENGLQKINGYFNDDDCNAFLESLIGNIIIDLNHSIDISEIAAKFHASLVQWIDWIANKEEVTKIGFSGGVFQNALLVDLIIFHLQDKYELLFHKDLSPNDENISFGQLIYASIDLLRPKDSVNC